MAIAQIISPTVETAKLVSVELKFPGLHADLIQKGRDAWKAVKGWFGK